MTIYRSVTTELTEHVTPAPQSALALAAHAVVVAVEAVRVSALDGEVGLTMSAQFKSGGGGGMQKSG